MGSDHVMVVAMSGGLEAILDDEVLLNRLSPIIKLVQDPSISESPSTIQVPPFRDYGYLQGLLAKKDGERPIFAHFRGSVLDNDRLRCSLRTLAQQRPHRFYWKEGLSAFYWQELSRSRYILCPHGHIRRVYDAMQAGAIPVVIADHWHLRPEVEAGVIRVRERDAYKLDQILTDIQPDEEAALLEYNASILSKLIWNLYTAPQSEDPFEQVMARLAQLKVKAKPTEKSHEQVLESVAEEEYEPEDEDRLDFGQSVRVEL